MAINVFELSIKIIDTCHSVLVIEQYQIRRIWTLSILKVLFDAVLSELFHLLNDIYHRATSINNNEDIVVFLVLPHLLFELLSV